MALMMRMAMLAMALWSSCYWNDGKDHLANYHQDTNFSKLSKLIACLCCFIAQLRTWSEKLWSFYKIAHVVLLISLRVKMPPLSVCCQVFTCLVSWILLVFSKLIDLILNSLKVVDWTSDSKQFYQIDFLKLHQSILFI